MNLCEHRKEIFINETGSKIYSQCKDCQREYERYRALERLMRQQPFNYEYCSNENCNNIFNKVSDHCKKCGSPPEIMAL